VSTRHSASAAFSDRATRAVLEPNHALPALQEIVLRKEDGGGCVMKFQSGKAKTGGRKKGTPNKITLDLIALLEEKGFNPAAKLVLVYRKAAKEWERHEEIFDAIQSKRISFEMTPLTETKAPTYLGIMEKAASELMQYVYPKRKAVEVSGPGGGPIETKDVSSLTDEQLDAELGRLMAKKAANAGSK
jgi:hypothetical protein